MIISVKKQTETDVKAVKTLIYTRKSALTGLSAIAIIEKSSNQKDYIQEEQLQRQKPTEFHCVPLG